MAKASNFSGKQNIWTSLLHTKPTKMKQLFVLSALTVLSFSSCHDMFGKRIHGNGNIKTETRSVSHFNGIDVSGSIDVYVKTDSISSIKIEADENLLEYIQVISDGDMLRIHTENGFNLDPSGKIKVFVSASTFKNFDASGACNIHSENKINSPDVINIGASGSCDVNLEVNTPKVVADLSGACNVELKGETKDFSVEGSGSNGIKTMGLMADNVDVDISGSGDADVYASSKLDIHISGSGDVQYKGNPQVSQSISGSGSVKKVE